MKSEFIQKKFQIDVTFVVEPSMNKTINNNKKVTLKQYFYTCPYRINNTHELT